MSNAKLFRELIVCAAFAAWGYFSDNSYMADKLHLGYIPIAWGILWTILAGIVVYELIGNSNKG